MVTLNDLSSIVDNNVLHELYMARDLTLSDVTEEDKQNLEQLYEKEKIDYKKLLSTLKAIPNISKETISSLEREIENHVDNNAQITAYFDEKLFKCGVIDGIILMLESKGVINAKNTR